MTPAAAGPTYVARLTPPGTGAIATLALRGPRAWQAVRGLFRSAGPTAAPLPEGPQSGTFWFGRLQDPSGTGMADEVVVAAKRPGSIAWVEVHCHGGPEVVRFLMEILQAQGLQPCSWQELEQRTATDRLQARAAAALAEARTARTAAILLDQYHGALTRALGEIRTALESGRVGDARERLEVLAGHSPVGRHLVHPWKVVVAGAPNVGKSTLVNALAGYQRSIVAPTPGTTRDVVTTLIALDGWPVELADTAGWRSDPEELERQGIDRAEGAALQADLCLWVLDHAAVPVWPRPGFPPVRFVVNKTDLPAAPGFQSPAGAIHLSATTGAGLDRLAQALVEWLVPDPPWPGAPVPFTPKLCDRIDEARRGCAAGRVDQALGLFGDPDW